MDHCVRPVMKGSTMVISEALYNNIESCLRNLVVEDDEGKKRRIVRHILHSLRENQITED